MSKNLNLKISIKSDPPPEFHCSLKRLKEHGFQEIFTLGSTFLMAEENWLWISAILPVNKGTDITKKHYKFKVKRNLQE